MKLLVINPNISDDVTALIESEALRSAAPGTELVVRTAGHGVEYIETRFESLIAAGAVAEIIAEYSRATPDGGTADRTDRSYRSAVDGPAVDAVVVAAFGDPGMPALKELADVPVIGITEAALCAAALQGHRFSIIAISDRIRPWYLDCVERFGLGGRLASIRSINESLNAIGSVQQDFKETLLALSRKAVTEDGADVADPRPRRGRHFRRHPHGRGRGGAPVRTPPCRRLRPAARQGPPGAFRKPRRRPGGSPDSCARCRSRGSCELGPPPRAPSARAL
jgi:Asp/Glu/hydantoin racemase